MTGFVDERYEERRNDQSIRNGKQVVLLVTDLPSDVALKIHV